jgi:hypothetical protein
MRSVGILENTATEVVDEILDVTFFIAEVLERLGVPYLPLVPLSLSLSLSLILPLRFDPG